jgi:hypothetical protein
LSDLNACRREKNAVRGRTEDRKENSRLRHTKTEEGRGEERRREREERIWERVKSVCTRPPLNPTESDEEGNRRKSERRSNRTDFEGKRRGPTRAFQAVARRRKNFERL